MRPQTQLDRIEQALDHQGRELCHIRRQNDLLILLALKNPQQDKAAIAEMNATLTKSAASLQAAIDSQSPTPLQES